MRIFTRFPAHILRRTHRVCSLRCASANILGHAPYSIVAGQKEVLASNKEWKAHCAPFPSPTHTCLTLSSLDVGSRVILAGWLLPERKVNKKLSFFNLKDAHGTVQLVVSATASGDALAAMRDMPTESTVIVEGTVKARVLPQHKPNSTGDVEIHLESLTLLNPASRNLPFMPSDTYNLANEYLRLQYRYLDLRRTALSENLKKRSKVAHIVRTVFHEQDFVEVETPILLKSTPEGAREFLVPTRLNAGSCETSSVDSDSDAQQPLFYALPQSPQQPKQLLVASGGVDRYYQLARCFRDEDGRKDRQPEFTQVDLEMAWVNWGENIMSEASSSSSPQGDASCRWRIGGQEVRDIVEKVVRRIWSEIEGIELPEHFQVMTYNEAMGRYGSDKPDLRFGLEIGDITAQLPTQLQETLRSRAELVEALILRKSCGTDQPFIAAAQKLKEALGADIACVEISKGQDMDWIGKDGLDTLGLSEGDVVFYGTRRRRPEGGSTTLGRLRLELANLAQASGDLELPSDPRFLWVTEFPLFTHADTDKEFLAHGRWSSSHHPFTAPMWQDIENMYGGRIAEVRGQHYDLVLNGVEIGGGSVRVHDAAMQEHIFSEILQLDSGEKASFGHLLHALSCGAPPHGGFAFGFDRLMAILCKTESIRDVIAFPKTSAGTDLLFKSPAPAKQSVLTQYGIKPL